MRYSPQISAFHYLLSSHVNFLSSLMVCMSQLFESQLSHINPARSTQLIFNLPSDFRQNETQKPHYLLISTTTIIHEQSIIVTLECNLNLATLCNLEGHCVLLKHPNYFNHCYTLDYVFTNENSE